MISTASTCAEATRVYHPLLEGRRLISCQRPCKNRQTPSTPKKPPPVDKEVVGTTEEDSLRILKPRTPLWVGVGGHVRHRCPPPLLIEELRRWHNVKRPHPRVFYPRPKRASPVAYLRTGAWSTVRYFIGADSRVLASARAEELPLIKCNQPQAMDVNIRQRTHRPFNLQHQETHTNKADFQPPQATTAPPPPSISSLEPIRLDNSETSYTAMHTAEPPTAAAPPMRGRNYGLEPAGKKENKKQIHEREAPRCKSGSREYRQQGATRQGGAVPPRRKTYPLDCLTSHCKTWSMLITCQGWGRQQEGSIKSLMFSTWMKFTRGHALNSSREARREQVKTERLEKFGREETFFERESDESPQTLAEKTL